VGGVPEILGENHGVLIPPNDAEALRQSFRKIIKNKGNPVDYKAADSALASFSEKEVAQKYQKLFVQLINNGPS